MTALPPAAVPPSPGRKVIFALDVSSLEDARKYVRLLKDRTGLFKVGLERFTAFGKEPGCAAHGKSPDTALIPCNEAINLWIDTSKEVGRPIPTPKGRRLKYA